MKKMLKEIYFHWACFSRDYCNILLRIGKPLDYSNILLRIGKALDKIQCDYNVHFVHYVHGRVQKKIHHACCKCDY